METPAWYAALLAARKMKGPFTAQDLGVASPYLAKLAGWGYLRRAGSRPGEKRWERLFVVTAWGRKKAAPREKRGRWGVEGRRE